MIQGHNGYITVNYNCDGTTMLYSTVLLKCRDQAGVHDGWGLWLVIVVVERLEVRVGVIVSKLLGLGNCCWGKAGPERLSSTTIVRPY